MKITVVNLVSKKVREYNLKELLEEGYPELKEVLMKLAEEGIEIDNFSGKISLNNLEEKIFSILFKDWELTDTRRIWSSEPGHPDFILQKGDRKIYCEWKNHTDGLRLNQLKWIIKHEDEEIFIIWIEDKAFRDILKISEEEIRKFVDLKVDRIVEPFNTLPSFPVTE